MRLTKKAIKLINNTKARMRIALALGCSEMSVRRYIETNDDNLTKAAAMVIVREETGLTDMEILMQEKDSVKA